MFLISLELYKCMHFNIEDLFLFFQILSKLEDFRFYFMLYTKKDVLYLENKYLFRLML